MKSYEEVLRYELKDDIENYNKTMYGKFKSVLGRVKDFLCMPIVCYHDPIREFNKEKINANN